MNRCLDDLLEAWEVHSEINLHILRQALEQSGVRPPQEVSYGTWAYWGGYALKEPAT